MKNFWLIFSVLFLSTQNVLANVVIYGTRVIYPGDKREVSIQLKNVGKAPALVQAWVESETQTNNAVPFIITPPVSRIDPDNGQVLRLMYTGENLPTDRESVYYLNILDIPPKPDTKTAESANYLQFSIQSRLKIFYRPAELVGKAGKAVKDVRWSLIRKSGKYYLQATNPTPYYVTFSRLELVEGKKRYAADHSQMLAPKSTVEFLLNNLHHTPKNGSQISYTRVNDYGVNVEGKASFFKK